MEPDRQPNCSDACQKPGGQKTHSNSPLTNGEVLPQRLIERLVRTDQEVVEARALRFRPQILDMSSDFFPVLAARIIGRYFDCLVHLHVDKQRRFAEFRINFPRIENVKQDHLISAKT